jgi:hypothetical protein
MIRVEDYISSQVSIVATKQQSLNNSLPVRVLSAPSTTVSGTVTANQGTLVAGGTANTIINSAASTNGTVVKGSAGTVYAVTVSNINAAVRYLKLYNSTTVTVGTTTPAIVIPIPAGGVVNLNLGAIGQRFATGICIGMTTGAADNDTGAVAAGEIKAMISYI